MKTVLPLVLLALVLGCRDNQLAIEVELPNAAGELRPAAGVAVLALPYDRDSILRSLENEAATPRPHTAALDSLFQRFREPYARSTQLAVRAGRLRDSLRLIESDPAREGLVAALRDSVAALEAEAAAATARLGVLREELGPTIDSLRLAARRWEDTVYRRYGEITASLTGNSLVASIVDTSRADGRARLILPPGSRAWWVHGRAFNAGDPNSEWYWNIPVTGTHIRLDTTTARLRPRY